MLVVQSLRRPGLEPVSFTLAAGECLVVQGPSGAGKSLLLRALADLDPNQGEVTLDGCSRAEFSGPAWRALVGYVPAEPGWWAERVGEHFLEWSSVPAARLGLAPDKGAQPVVQCSTGERQRLALLRALERRPRVLLLDEPTSALDRASTLAVEQLVVEACAGGMGVVWVSHDPDQAERLSPRRLLVERGRASAA
jgi:putative ABC transport system ATP-binding protein